MASEKQLKHLAKVRAQRRLDKQRRWAEEMRADGWTVMEPAGLEGETKTK